ncbi:tyrosine-type recombinase/integrase [Microbulbifer sp. CAU 1566]|uniref:tyrosine-type recombinase/integrase n=1 Tax=Microbulbifer sp. CAU 1566 TaxID=2933269 RepID=UPI002004C215|nr:tyrosine-type recombinase/integrase [Microbulbifer sp. CAU 1566]MCK7597405.1 tyrosine-type recombinase/integrase [Microbulbifer sp. CAU 1566]
MAKKSVSEDKPNRVVTTDLQIARLPAEDGQPMYKVNGVEYLYVQVGKRSKTFYALLPTGKERLDKFHPQDYTKAKAAAAIKVLLEVGREGSQKYDVLRDQYLGEYLPKLSTNTANKTARVFDIYLDPLLAGHNFANFPVKKANDLIRRVRDKKHKHPETGKLCGGHGPAAKVATQLRNMADWFKKEFHTSHPFENIDNSHLNIESAIRGRILSRRELRMVQEALEQSRTAERTKIAIYLLMSLGVRTGDLLMAEWHDFSADFSYWDLPGWKHKSGKPQLIPIPAQVRPLFKRLFEITGFNKTTAKRRDVYQDGYWILGDLPPGGIGTALDRLQEGFRYKTGIPLLIPEGDKINAHDLRRSFSTYLNSMRDTRPLVIEKLLGHCIKGIAATYNKAGYLEERAEYLSRYADCLVDPEKLLPVPDNRVRPDEEGDVIDIEFERLALPGVAV